MDIYVKIYRGICLKDKIKTKELVTTLKNQLRNNASLEGEPCFIMRLFVVVVDKSSNY